MNLPQQPINEFEKHLQKVKIKHIPSDVHTILDIGCGDGSVFNDTRFSCHGYDIDSKSLAIAKQCKNYDVTSTNFSVFNPQYYDCVTICGTLEHMEKEDIVSLLFDIGNAKRVYITVPNANSFHRNLGVNMSIIENIYKLQSHDYSIGHKRYYDIELLKNHVIPLISDGFRIEAMGSEGFKFDTSLNMIKYLPNIDSIESTARQAGLIGIDKFYGAELFMYLRKV